MQCFIKPVAGRVTGKDSAGPVSSVSRGSKANDEQPSLRIAETGYWLAPVRPLTKLALFFARHLAAVLTQPDTPLAPYDRAGNALKRVQHDPWASILPLEAH